MKRILAVVAAVVTVMFLAAPAAFAHTKVSRTPPRIDSGVTIALDINPGLCIETHGRDNQLTDTGNTPNCARWHFTGVGQVIDGGGNCMRENGSFQITVVSNCSTNDAAQLFTFKSCGTNCHQIINDKYGNYVSTTGPADGDKIWGGFSPPNHIDWEYF